MKKIILASAAMGGAALIAFGASGTFANFTDQTQVSNGVGAGTLYLTAGTTSASSRATGEVSSLAPGDTATYTFYAGNAGNQAGTMTATFQLLSDEDNGCTVPEGRVDTTCDDSRPGDGELVENTTAVARFGAANGASNCGSGTPGLQTVDYGDPTRGGLGGLSGLDDKNTSLRVEQGQGLCVVLTVTLPRADNNNVVQSDTAEFGIDYRLDQVTS